MNVAGSISGIVRFTYWMVPSSSNSKMKSGTLSTSDR